MKALLLGAGTGISAVGAFVVGIVTLGEPANIGRVVAVALIILGVSLQ